MGKSKKKRTKKNKGQDPPSSHNSDLNVSTRHKAGNKKDCTTDPVKDVNGKGQQIEDDATAEANIYQGLEYENFKNVARPDDLVSNAGNTSSSQLLQSTIDKATLAARREFRERRHRLELEKLKVEQALDILKDEEECAINDAVLKLALEFEQGTNQEVVSQRMTQNEQSKELWAKKNEQIRFEAQRGSKRVPPAKDNHEAGALSHVNETSGRKTSAETFIETTMKKLTFEGSGGVAEEIWGGQSEARLEKDQVSMTEYYYTGAHDGRTSRPNAEYECHYNPEFGRHNREREYRSEDAGQWQTQEHRPRSEGKNRSEIEMLINALRAPQVTIPIFNGDPLEYHPFIQAFEETVERFVFDNGSRFTSLMAHCSGEPARLLKGCSQLPSHKKYREARRLLEERYGNEYRITMLWIERVTEMQGRPSLREISDTLKTCQIAVEAIGSTALINHPVNLQKIVRKLSVPLQDRWARVARNVQKRQNRPPLFDDLVCFIEEEAELIHDPVFGKHVYNHERSNRPTNFGVMATVKCSICNGDHKITKCHEFAEKSYEERMEAAKMKRLCFNCLKPGHLAQNCESDERCEVNGCGRKHATLLYRHN